MNFDTRINADNINIPYLKEIFLGNSEGALAELNKVRATSKWVKEYEHDLLMAFWLAVHCGNVEIS